MSIATELARIKGGVAGIRSKYVELGLSQSTDKIDALATASEQIENKGAITATVAEGTTYTIPKGYHNGSGTVTGIAPAATGTIEKWWSPKMTSNTTPSPYEVYSYNFSDDVEIWKVFDDNNVTEIHQVLNKTSRGIRYILFDFSKPVALKGVRFIPGQLSEDPNFYDDKIVLTVNFGNEIIFEQSGNFIVSPSDETKETIVSNFSLDQVISLTKSNQKHIGHRYVRFEFWVNSSLLNPTPNLKLSDIEFLIEEPVTKYSLQSTKSVTPTTQQQNVTPDSGYYGLSGVTIEPIPNNYKDVSVVSATASDILSSKTIIDRTGELVTGTIPNLGDVSTTFDGLTATTVDLEAGYCEESTIELDDSIEQALAEI